MSDSIFSGVVEGAYLATGSPFLFIRNLVKFHFIFSEPNKPFFSLAKNSNKGWASSPLTSTLLKTGKVFE